MKVKQNHVLLPSSLAIKLKCCHFSITCPILILHAADDHIIPVKLGQLLRVGACSFYFSLFQKHINQQLFQDAALKAKRDVTYQEFEASRELQHKYIYTALELPGIVE